MPNAWVNYVKSYCSKHNMSYRDALKDPKCKAGYKKKTGGMINRELREREITGKSGPIINANKRLLEEQEDEERRILALIDTPPAEVDFTYREAVERWNQLGRQRRRTDADRLREDQIFTRLWGELFSLLDEYNVPAADEVRTYYDWVANLRSDPVRTAEPDESGRNVRQRGGKIYKKGGTMPVEVARAKRNIPIAVELRNMEAGLNANARELKRLLDAGLEENARELKRLLNAGLEENARELKRLLDEREITQERYTSGMQRINSMKARINTARRGIDYSGGKIKGKGVIDESEFADQTLIADAYNSSQLGANAGKKFISL